MDKMTWQEFQEWQRWDEFPESADNPPLTVDVCFVYEGNKYYIVKDYGAFHIYSSDWSALYTNDNFKTLLTTPITLFKEKSFADVCSELEFE